MEDVYVDLSQSLKFRTTTITPSQLDIAHFFTELKLVIMSHFSAVFLIRRSQSMIDSSYYSSTLASLTAHL